MKSAPKHQFMDLKGRFIDDIESKRTKINLLFSNLPYSVIIYVHINVQKLFNFLL